LAEIIIITHINSTLEITFDLSQSIELHEISTRETNEQAVEGVTTGLIGPSETVTWRARHLFRTRFFTSKITAFTRPYYFKDEMQQGDFKKFVHEHFFENNENGILMKDKLLLEAPFGLMGKLATELFLKTYISNLVVKRNEIIKAYAESGEWRKILNKHE
jgi:ligand-binding SRPBCC domain-containing protein